MKQYILFDLDGTLTDPKEGITTCVQYALADFGIDEPDLDKLEPFIGPPLKESFQNFYNMTEEQADRAVEKYRERFNETGIFENELYGGIHDLLGTLKKGGLHLAVASSKPTVYVERILKHFKIDKYFEVVVGSELDGTRTSKPQVIQEVLHRFFPNHQVRYDEVFMVGDRKFDIEGAKLFRIETIGVTYGYGSMEELKEAKADYIVTSVTELKKLLLREVEAIERKKAEENPGAAGQKAKPQSNKILMRMLIPFALYYIVKMAATSIMSLMLQSLCVNMPALEKYLFVKDEVAETMTFTSNAYVFCQIIGFLAAGFMIRKYAQNAITKIKEETKLSYLKKEPVKNYVLIAVATLGAVIGINLLTIQSGILETTENYALVWEMQYSGNILLGLVCYGVIIPVVEELMFRGIIFNCIKKALNKVNLALLLSAFFHGSFNSDSTQIMYIFVIGLIMAYAYQLFGSFYMPMALHVGAGIVTYLMYRFTGAESTAAGQPVAYVALVIAIVAFVLLEKEKGILKKKEAAPEQ